MRKLFLVLMLLIPTQAMATQRVWISEFGGLAPVGSGAQAQIGPLPVITRQQVDTTGGVQTSAAFNSATRYIRVICEVQCAIRGDGTAAAATDTLLPSYLPEYFGVQPGATISVIAAP